MIFIFTATYLVFFTGFSIHFVSAAFAISSEILDDITSKGTITCSIYETGFLKVIPLTLIASFILWLSSINDGKNLKITATGIETVWGNLILSIEDIMLPKNRGYVWEMFPKYNKYNYKKNGR